MVDALLNDVRYAFRMLKKSPGFTSVALLTLGLAIGANTAIFSVIDHVMLRPLAYRDAGQLVAIHEAVPKFAKFAPLIPVNAMHFLEWRKSAKSFESIALIGGKPMSLTGVGEPAQLRGARVSSSLFPMLGVQPLLGRMFTEEEDHPGRDRVAILNHEVWQRRFGGDTGVVGRKILLDGEPYIVVGVLPADFRFPKLSQLFAMTTAQERPEIWKPFGVKSDELDPLGDFNYAAIGRLKTGVSLARASEELNRVQAAIARTFPEKLELHAQLIPLADQITGRSKTGLALVLGAVGAVLLIGCVNLANLLLARAASRRREIAIRMAIGASRGRLLTQTLVESLTLSSLGGLVGLAIAFVALPLILRNAPGELPRMDEVGLDPRVMAFTALISIGSGLLFGILPAWSSSGADPQDAMRAGARGSTAGRGMSRARSMLIGTEVALSAMALVAAGLLLHSFSKLLQVDRGFDVERVVTVDLSLGETRYPNQEARSRFLRAAMERVRVLPGVTSAGVSNMLPLAGEGGNNLLSVEGTTVPLTERPLVDVRQVNPDYLRTIGIAVRKGRVFTEADRTRPVVLMSAMTASRIYPGQEAIGKRFRIGGENSPLMEVIGIAGDVRGVSLNQAPSMTIYVPYWQRNYRLVSIALRTSLPASTIYPAVRDAIHAVDSEMAVAAPRTMQEIVSESVAQRRFQMTLVLLFGVAAMLLASLGIYGVISFSVTQRLNEMGIRMALGARSGNIRFMVLRQSLGPVCVGLLSGIACSLLLGRVLRSLLFEVTPADPWTIAGVVLVLMGVGAGATYLPARRATLVDPASALRYE